MAYPKSKTQLRRLSGALLGALALAILAAAPAFAGQTSYSGTEAGVSVGSSGTALGLLTLPANLVLTDILGTNTSGSPIETTDDWTFSIPSPSSLGSTNTGEQLDLTKLSFAGTLDSVVLYSGIPGSSSTLATASITNNTFAGLVYELTAAGSYYIEVQSTLNPGATGSDTGTLQISAVPEPSSWVLAFAGLGVIGTAAFLRKRS